MYQVKQVRSTLLKQVDGKDALQVNWAELTISDTKGKERKHRCFATHHPITEDSVVSLVKLSRNFQAIAGYTLYSLVLFGSAPPTAARAISIQRDQGRKTA